MKYRATIYKDGGYWIVEICKQKAVIMRYIADTWDNALNWACFQLSHIPYVVSQFTTLKA